jgi:hypothetical protein
MKAKEAHVARVAQRARCTDEGHHEGAFLPILFMLEKMCGLIKSGVHTERRVKNVHLIAVFKTLFEYCGVEVTST